MRNAEDHPSCRGKTNWEVTLTRRLCRAGSLAGIVLAAVTLFASCGGGVRAGVFVGTPPPPALYEAPVAAPGPGFVWIAGWQRWDGNRYVWVPGRWERPPRGRHHWQPGHWSHNHHGWSWHEGHWR